MHGPAGHHLGHHRLPAPGYPATRLAVHLGQPCGVPRHPERQAAQKGDIVNVDVTVITKDGWYGDNSRMYLIGECSIAAKRLVPITFEAMWHGILQVRPGARLGDIGHAIQKFAEGHGFSVVREFCGHGIGKNFHEEPQVLHYGRPGTLEELKWHGVHHRTHDQRRAARDQEFGNDGWTIVTKDRSLSAQWEHTVLVTPTGYEVMTLSAGSPALPSFVTASHLSAPLRARFCMGPRT